MPAGRTAPTQEYVFGHPTDNLGRTITSRVSMTVPVEEFPAEPSMGVNMVLPLVGRLQVRHPTGAAARPPRTTR